MSLLHEKWETREPRAISTYAHHTAKWSIDVLRPSVFAKTPRKELTSTSWLDGLRGFAALLVYFQHHQGWAHVDSSANMIMESAFGYNNQYYFACLPGIRLFFTGGHVSVSVFFIISGYVLSAKPLALIHSGELTKLEDNLSSAMFKRWLRLFLPTVVTTAVYATSWHLFGIWTAVPPHQPNYIEEVIYWYHDFTKFSWVFRGGDMHYSKYNFHLWSIAFEFRGSIIIFTSLLAFSRFKRNARLLCEVGLIFYLVYITEGILYALFPAGMLFCDLELLARNNNLPSFFYTYLIPYKKLLINALFLAGIYLSGVPAIDFLTDISLLKSSPGWNWLSYLKPTSVSETDYKWFYLFYASTFLFISISQSKWLKRFFEMRFNQYLGRISFAFYLVHGPILWMLADRLYLAAGIEREKNIDGIRWWMGTFLLPKGGPLGLEWRFWGPQVVVLPLTLWVAEVCTRVVDKPSIRVAQWLYRKVVVQDLR